MDKNSKIIIPGGAGLVGQNTVTDLINQGYTNLVVLDKHKKKCRNFKKYASKYYGGMCRFSR